MLFSAIKASALETVNYLISEGVDVNQADDYGYTALHITIQSHLSLNLCKALLDAGAHIDAKNEETETALCLALTEGADKFTTAKYLIARGARTSFDGEKAAQPLQCVINTCGDKPENFDYESYLLNECGADVNAQSSESTGAYTALHYAVQLNDCDLVRFLLENGADKSIANDDGQTPLDLANDCFEEGIPLLK